MVQHIQSQNKNSIDSLTSKSQNTNTEAIVDIAQYRDPNGVDTTSSAFVKVMAQMNIDNRSSFDEMYKKYWLEASNHNKLLSILLCDIDFFQAYKDNCGEQSTSFMLIVVALKLKNICDEYGCFLAYYQNEGFAILHKGGDEKQALEIAEALRHAVEDSKTEHNFSEVSDVVTLSIGISSIYPTSMKLLMQQADQSLQQVKKIALDKVAASSLPKTKTPTLTKQVITQKDAVVIPPVAKTSVNVTSTAAVKNTSQYKMASAKVEAIKVHDVDIAKENSHEKNIPKAVVTKNKVNTVNAPIANVIAKQKNVEISDGAASVTENKMETASVQITDNKPKLSIAESAILESHTDVIDVVEDNDEAREQTNIGTLSSIDNTEINTVEPLAAPLKKKTIKRHINALKSLVTKTSNTPKLESSVSETSTPLVLDEVVKSETTPISSLTSNGNDTQIIEKDQVAPTPSLEKNAKELHIETLKTAIPLSNELKLTESKPTETPVLKNTENNELTFTPSNEKTLNDKLSSDKKIENETTPTIAAKSSIELHIEALKAAKTKKSLSNELELTESKPTETPIPKNTENNELTLTTSNDKALNDKLSTGNKIEHEATPTTAAKSTIELHIEALKAAKTKQKSTNELKLASHKPLENSVPEDSEKQQLTMSPALGKIEGEHSETPASKSKTSHKLSAGNEKEKAPKSAIERHIEALKAAKNKKSVTETVSNNQSKVELSLNKSEAKKITTVSNSPVKTELTLTENEVEKVTTASDSPVKTELTLTENEVETVTTASDSPVKAELTLTENEVEKVNSASDSTVKAELTLTENEADKMNSASESPVKAELTPTDNEIITPEKAPIKEVTEQKTVIRESKAKVALQDDQAITVDQAPIDESSTNATQQKSEVIEPEQAPMNEAEVKVDPKEKPSEVAKPKNAIERHIEALKAAKSKTLEKNKLNVNKESGVTELQRRLLEEMVDNKPAFDKKIKAIWQECREEDELLSMVVIGMDFFKSYQTNYGEEASERALIAIAATLRKTCEKLGAFIYHLGSQNFIVLLKGGNATKALRMAEQITKGVLAQGNAHKYSSVSKVITVSVGLSSIFPGNTNSIGMLSEDAEDAYEMAIRCGRNQTYLG